MRRRLRSRVIVAPKEAPSQRRGASSRGGLIAALIALIALAGCREGAEAAQVELAASAPGSVVTAPSGASPLVTPSGAASVSANAASATPDAQAPLTDLERAQSAAQAMSGELRRALTRAMQTSGPEAAVDVCHAVAPTIAEQVMQQHGVRLGRVALPGKNRHPQQAADDWQLAALQGMQQAVERGGRAEEQVLIQRDELPAGVALRMVRGIATEEACLTCHGAEVKAPIREAILRRYPQDAATGFALGDLRGALWVEVPAR